MTSESLLGTVRDMPPVVAAYAVVQGAVIVYGLATATKLWNHPVAAVAVTTILLFWLTAIVLWRVRGCGP